MEEFVELRFQEALVSWTDTIYVHLESAGKGGTAQTFLMLATSGPYKGVQFAVKIFRKLSRPQWRYKFMREINFLRTCSHPAIVRVFDEGLYLDDHPFVVMEYLPEKFAEVIPPDPSNVAQPDLDKLRYALQLLSAL